MTGCLVKDADLRYQSLWDVLIETAKVTAHTGDNAAVERKRTWLPWAAAVVLGVTTIAVSTAYFRKAPLDAATVRFNIDPPDGFSGAFQLSPNGRYLTMVSQRKLWIRELGSLEAKAVDGVEDPSYPFWSPDSAAIGFVAQQRLKAVTLAGGRIRTICDPGSDRTRGASERKTELSSSQLRLGYAVSPPMAALLSTLPKSLPGERMSIAILHFYRTADISCFCINPATPIREGFTSVRSTAERLYAYCLTRKTRSTRRRRRRTRTAISFSAARTR